MNTLASPGFVRRIGAPVSVMLAALLALVIIGCALLAGWIAPYDPTDLATFELINAELPPAFMADGDPRFLLGTDNQGRDLLSAMMYGARVLHRHRRRRGPAGGQRLAFFLGLLAGYFGGKVDALIMRIGDVILSFPTILLALLVSGIARALFPAGGDGRMGAAHPDLRHRDSRMGAICPHRAGRHHGGDGEGLREGRQGHRPAVPPHHAAAHPAERDGPGARHRHHQSRGGRPDRGYPVVPRRRNAAHLSRPLER